MRWTLRREGDIRYKRRFLFLPKTINRECRWLEMAEWREEFRFSGCWWEKRLKWKLHAWVDAE